METRNGAGPWWPAFRQRSARAPNAKFAFGKMQNGGGGEHGVHVRERPALPAESDRCLVPPCEEVSETLLTEEQAPTIGVQKGASMAQ